MKNAYLIQIMTAVLIAVFASYAGAVEEQQLISVLRSDADAPGKCAACVQLRIYGTVESVDALAALLNDERVGQAARYALEGMPFPEAGLALCEALGRTSGSLKAGLIDSLGWRRDRNAVGLLIPLLSDRDMMLATASATALGRIGGPDSVTALMNVSKTADAQRTAAVSDALMKCAEDLAAAGDKDQAGKIYTDLYESANDLNLKAACLKGLSALAEVSAQFTWIEEGLKSPHKELQDVAVQMAYELKDPNTGKKLVKLLNNLAPEAKVPLLSVLAERGDKEAMSAVVDLAGHSDPHVRIAAIHALSSIGDSSCADMLLTKAAGSGPEAEAAREALANLPDNNLNARLIDKLPGQRPDIRVQAIETLVKRNAGEEAAKTFIRLASSSDASTSSACVKALTEIAGPEHFEELVNLHAKVDRKNKSKLEPAIYRLGQELEKSENQDGISMLLARTRAERDMATRISLINIITMSGRLDVMEFLKQEINSEDKELARASLRSMADWPNSDALETLKQIAHTDEGVRQILALRGYIKMIGLTEVGPDQKLNMYQDAFALAEQTSEKKAVIAGLGQVYSRDSILYLADLMNEAPLKNEAQVSLINVSKKMYGAWPELIKPLMSLILSDGSGFAKENAAQVLDLIKQNEEYITAWQQTTPYSMEGLDFYKLINHPFDPELTKVSPDYWQPAAPASDSAFPFMLDFTKLFPSMTNCVIYIRTVIETGQSGTYNAELGSDDGVKVWVNGSVVYVNNAARPFAPAQDKFKVPLEKGRNLLMIKVTQMHSGWSVAMRLTDADGKVPQNIRIDPEVTAADMPEAFAVQVPQQGCVRDVEGSLRFTKKRISDVTYEAASIFDVDNDGIKDIVSGEYWFPGPDFQTRHKIGTIQPAGDYFDDFSDYPMDVNGDGFLDIVTGAWFTAVLRWRENPRGGTSEWPVHTIDACGNIETIRFWDVDGDGYVEVVPNLPGAPLHIYRLIRDVEGHGTGRFDKITIHNENQGHGLGYGDINGDGRGDFVLSYGWLEAPEKPFEQKWILHRDFNLGGTSVPVLVYDVDRDGISDLIEGQGHGYGLNWWKQQLNPDGTRTWMKHPIDTLRSQYHDMMLADLDKDAEPELITGKRYRAHSGGDPGSTDPVGIYYFEINNGVFLRTVLDYGPAESASGAGIYFWIDDIDENGYPDVLAPGKEGLYLFSNMGSK